MPRRARGTPTTIRVGSDVIWVVFATEAQADLIELYDDLAARGGPGRALAFTERIEATCRHLALFPARGTRRDDIRPGLRVIGLARRVTIGFHVWAGR